jgi:hypothetical protein
MSTLFIIAFVLMVVGFILTFFGVLFYEYNIGQQSQPLWVWFLIFTGGILSVVGALGTMLMLGRDSDPDDIREIIGDDTEKKMTFQVYNDE